MSLTLILASFVFILNLLWFFWYRQSSKIDRNQSEIPGLKSSDPNLGNLVDVGRAGSLHKFLTDLHRRLGPITSFYWGKTLVVSVASTQAFQETRRLFDRPVLLFSAFEPLIGINSIQYANGQTAKHRRKFHYDAALLPRNILKNDFQQVFEQVLVDQLQMWKTNELEKNFPLKEQMLITTMKSIVAAAFGTSFSFEELKSIENSYEICWNQMENVIRGQTMTEEQKKIFDEARENFCSKTKQIIERRRERLGTDKKCFIDFILQDEEFISTEDQICSEIITMFVGGFHTTGNLLTWIFYYLAKDDQIQERLSNEIEEFSKNQFPTIDELDKMSFLTNVINESLRVFVLAPWAARISTEDNLIVCGKTIPAGTPIIQALGVVLEDEQIWKNPKKFDPDRFSDENKKQISTMAFSPFGFAGKRICPGYRFAFYEAAFFVCAILKNFRLNLVDPEAIVVPVHSLVTSPKDEIFLRLDRKN